MTSWYGTSQNRSKDVFGTRLQDGVIESKWQTSFSLYPDNSPLERVVKKKIMWGLAGVSINF